MLCHVPVVSRALSPGKTNFSWRGSARRVSCVFVRSNRVCSRLTRVSDSASEERCQDASSGSS
jgi:hypothetical protein